MSYKAEQNAERSYRYKDNCAEKSAHKGSKVYDDTKEYADKLHNAKHLHDHHV